MIKLSNAIVIANTSDELTALQGLLTPSYPEFAFEILDNTNEEKDNFPFKMQVNINPDMAIPSMPEFFQLLVTKIDQLNQTA